MAVKNRDRTINYVGFIGHMAFGSGTDTIGDEPLIRIEYRRFITGEEDFLYRKPTV